MLLAENTGSLWDELKLGELLAESAAGLSPAKRHGMNHHPSSGTKKQQTSPLPKAMGKFVSRLADPLRGRFSKYDEIVGPSTKSKGKLPASRHNQNNNGNNPPRMTASPRLSSYQSRQHNTKPPPIVSNPPSNKGFFLTEALHPDDSADEADGDHVTVDPVLSRVRRRLEEATKMESMLREGRMLQQPGRRGPPNQRSGISHNNNNNISSNRRVAGAAGNRTQPLKPVQQPLQPRKKAWEDPMTRQYSSDRTKINKRVLQGQNNNRGRKDLPGNTFTNGFSRNKTVNIPEKTGRRRNVGGVDKSAGTWAAAGPGRRLGGGVGIGASAVPAVAGKPRGRGNPRDLSTTATGGLYAGQARSTAAQARERGASLDRAGRKSSNNNNNNHNNHHDDDDERSVRTSNRPILRKSKTTDTSRAAVAPKRGGPGTRSAPPSSFITLERVDSEAEYRAKAGLGPSPQKGGASGSVGGGSVSGTGVGSMVSGAGKGKAPRSTSSVVKGGSSSGGDPSVATATTAKKRTSNQEEESEAVSVFGETPRPDRTPASAETETMAGTDTETMAETGTGTMVRTEAGTGVGTTAAVAADAHTAPDTSTFDVECGDTPGATDRDLTLAIDPTFADVDVYEGAAGVSRPVRNATPGETVTANESTATVRSQPQPALQPPVGVVARDRYQLLGFLAELEQKEASRLKDKGAGGGGGNGSASVSSAGSKGVRKTSKAGAAAAAAAAAASTGENAALASLLSRQARRITDHLAAAERTNALYAEIDGTEGFE